MFLRTDHIPNTKPSMAPAAVPSGFSNWKWLSIFLPPRAPRAMVDASFVPIPANRKAVLVAFNLGFDLGSG